MSRAVVLIALALAGCAKAQPARTGGIVSTNPCADQLLIALAPRDRIAAISHYSQEAGATSIPLDVARSFAATAGTAEEVIALKPDLVLASSFTPAPTLAAYRRLGLKVLLLDSPTTIAESRDQVRSVAAAIGDPGAGERLVARIDKAVTDAAPRDAARPSAMLYIADNFANGGPSLLTEMMGKAGFGAADAAFRMNFSKSIPIERLAAHPPHVVLVPNFQARIATLRRKVLDRMAANTVEARFAPTLMNCGGPTIIEAMQRLAAIRGTIAS